MLSGGNIVAVTETPLFFNSMASSSSSSIEREKRNTMKAVTITTPPKRNLYSKLKEEDFNYIPDEDNVQKNKKLNILLNNTNIIPNIIIMGPAEVGKSVLRNRIRNKINFYDNETKDYKPTLDNRSMVVTKTGIYLNLHDTSGSIVENENLVKKYINTADGIILIYSEYIENSENIVKNIIKYINEYKTNFPIMVIENFKEDNISGKIKKYNEIKEFFDENIFFKKMNILKENINSFDRFFISYINEVSLRMMNKDMNNLESKNNNCCVLSYCLKCFKK